MYSLDTSLKSIITIMILCSSLSTIKAQSNKPSFDCSKAAIGAEIAICNDEKLAVLDVLMANTYNKLRRNIPSLEQEILFEQQVEWLKERNACAENTTCLENAIQERATDLQTELERIILPPIAGATLISSGFVPDPMTFLETFTGNTNAKEWSENCEGFIDENNPSVTLHIDPNISYLGVYIESEIDASLVVLHHTTFGVFPLCNESSSNDLPMLEFTQAGNYEIFVGSLEEIGTRELEYTLYISELLP